MNFEEYANKFREKALKAGYSEEQIKYYLAYAKVLLKQNLPVIYNSSHLGALTGYSVRYLVRAASYTKHFYRTFSIPKKNGKQRIINEPLPSLKEIQLWINKEILSKIKPSKFAKAYVAKRGLIDNVRYHRNKNYILSLDLENFFPSINLISINSFFKKLGYSERVANMLAKLCCLNGQLSQGAPTSPYISNLLLFEFDEYIGDFAIKNNLRYTRYADDLTFSFNEHFDKDEIINKVNFALKKFIPNSKLVINKEKTKLLRKSDRQEVTGVVVNEKIQTPINYRKKIRQEFYYIKKFGLRSHLHKINENRDNYLNHLLGKINFVLSINKEDKEMISYKSTLQVLLKNI